MTYDDLIQQDNIYEHIIKGEILSVYEYALRIAMSSTGTEQHQQTMYGVFMRDWNLEMFANVRMSYNGWVLLKSVLVKTEKLYKK